MSSSNGDTFRNFIGGEWCDSADGATSSVVDPSTGEEYARAVVSGPADVDRAMGAAEAAFESWRDTTPSERSLALIRIADAIEAHGDELMSIESRNCGKPYAVHRGEEIGPMVDQIRFFAGAARHLEGRAASEYMAGMTSMIRREPVGVCAQVAPWNYPMMMAVWKFAPAIAAGNTVVLKPSDTTPASTTRLAEIAAEFLPAGVLNVICGDRDTGRAMVEHETPAMVSVTGSVRAGQEVAAAASSSLKRVHLELGGKAPVVVFDDADLDSAVEGLVDAIWFNQGQVCCAGSRLLVQEGIADRFHAKLRARMDGLRIGDPLDKCIDVGAVVDPIQLQTIKGMVDSNTAGEVYQAACALPENGCFYPPTLISGLETSDPLMQEEIFGPVLTSIPFSTEEEALQLANDTQYGLTGYLWTNDLTRALRFTNKLEAGMIWVNSENVRHLPTPFGGVKSSGVGRDGGDWSFEFYMEQKHIGFATGQHKITQLGK